MPFVLDRQKRRALIASGAIMGALIGPLGLWLHVRARLSDGARQRSGSVSETIGRLADRVWSLESGWAGLLVLAVPFVATLILMPRFIRWLETRVDRDPAPFYFQAGLGGVAVGAVATALIAWGLLFTAVIWGTTGSAGADPAESGSAILGGGLIFGPLMGLVAPFLFVRSIVALGVPFGLLYGALVRHLARNETA